MDVEGSGPAANAGALPAGKLPPESLRSLIGSLGQPPDVVMGPGIGRDVAVVDLGETWLVCKTDPITFASDRIGWYAVHVNANDLATAGAEARWFMATLLLPEGTADGAMAISIMDDLRDAAGSLGVSVIGGHTEITPAVDRPVVAGTMLGVVAPSDLIRPDGLRAGDEVVLTGGLAIEATSIVARETPGRLREAGMDDGNVAAAAAYLDGPGISVVLASQLARKAAGGSIHAMHDPTEGGVATALEEMAEASGRDIHLEVDPDAFDAATSPLTAEVCRAVGIDPRGAISSGALLIATAPGSSAVVREALGKGGIESWPIAVARAGQASAGSGCRMSRAGIEWPVFERDEIARIFAG